MDPSRRGLAESSPETTLRSLARSSGVRVWGDGVDSDIGGCTAGICCGCVWVVFVTRVEEKKKYVQTWSEQPKHVILSYPFSKICSWRHCEVSYVRQEIDSWVETVADQVADERMQKPSVQPKHVTFLTTLKIDASNPHPRHQSVWRSFDDASYGVDLWVKISTIPVWICRPGDPLLRRPYQTRLEVSQ